MYRNQKYCNQKNCNQKNCKQKNCKQKYRHQRYRHQHCRHHQQSGLGLVGAIFVIVVVSLLSVAMSRMLEADKISQSYEILGLKALLAAESGAQLAVNRLMPPDSAGSCADRTFDFEASSLRFCQAVVTCTTTTANGENYYTVSSRGQCDASDFTASRTLEVRLSP